MIANAGEPSLRVFGVVPGGRLKPGNVEYHVLARIGGEIVAEERRRLRVGTQPRRRPAKASCEGRKSSDARHPLG